MSFIEENPDDFKLVGEKLKEFRLDMKKKFIEENGQGVDL